MGRPAKQVEAGEVVLVGKPVPKEPPKVVTVAPTTLEKMKPKRERTEKQKESTAKMIEANKKKAAERKGVVTGNIPEVIPEDKVLLTVLPKRKYVRKVPAWNARVEPPPQIPVETEVEETDEEVPPPRKVEKKKTVKKVAKPKRYETETSETSGYEDSQSSEEEDDGKLEKYVRKAHKRMEAVQEIDNRLKAMKAHGRYSTYSIF
jgi:hypothetical protein